MFTLYTLKKHQCGSFLVYFLSLKKGALNISVISQLLYYLRYLGNRFALTSGRLRRVAHRHQGDMHVP